MSKRLKQSLQLYRDTFNHVAKLIMAFPCVGGPLVGPGGPRVIGPLVGLGVGSQ